MLTLRRAALTFLIVLLCDASVVAEKETITKSVAEKAKEWTQINPTPKEPVASSDARIINGNNAGSTRYKYAVSIQDGNFHFCGGSLIAPNIVLSAAHCAPGNVNNIKANINQYNLNNPIGQNKETIQVIDYLTHPNYSKSTDLANDFMLIKLESNSVNPPVTLNTASGTPNIGQDLTVVGWGTTTEGVNDVPTVLQEVEVNYISNSQCKNTYGSGSVSNDMLCCMEDGKGSCQGDSGGPLVIRGADGSTDVQVGVVSWGYDCALVKYPGVYSRVSSAWPWIRENVCEMSGGQAPAYFECAPPLPQTNVLVQVQMDTYPQELGWRIVKPDGGIVIQRNPGSYNTPSQLVSEVVSLNEGGSFVFEVIDQASDGICCEYGSGSLAVYLGSTAASNKYLAFSNGDFEDAVDIGFTASSDGIIDVGGTPTAAPAIGGAPEADYVVKFTTDLYPLESSWAIQSLQGDTLYEGNPFMPDTVETTTVQLIVGETYLFVVEDKFGDGVCCTFGDGRATIYFGTSTDDEYEVLNVPGESFEFVTSIEFVAEDLGDDGGVGDTGSVGDTGGIPPIGCFPGNAKLQVKGQGTVMMKNIQLGDKVLVEGGKYEPVYSFAHRVEQDNEEYQQLVTHSTTLELTKEHMVFVEGGHSVPAFMVKPGDNLELANGGFDIVKSTRTVIREGSYAPFTASGTVIVSGVKASTFIAFQGSETLKVAGLETGLTFQSVSHAFERPHRVWCQYFSDCTEERYTADGMSVWVATPFKIARWAFNQKAVLTSSVAVPLACLVLLGYPILFLTPLLMLLVIASKRLSLRVKAVQLGNLNR